MSGRQGGMSSRPSALRLLLIALLLAAPRGAAAATLYVNDAGGDCAFPAAHTTIQSAVDAAKLAGAKRIHVCPGDYAELVTIDGFGTLTLEADPGVTLRPPGPVASATLVDVRDSRRVVVRGFTLDGDGQFSGAGTSVRGISYLDTSGTIEGNSIFGIRPEPFTASFAHAIHVSDNLGSVRITIRANTLGGYGQLGMDVTARSVKILDNVLAGSGPTDVVAQVGIILRNVTRGRVARNTVGRPLVYAVPRRDGHLPRGVDPDPGRREHPARQPRRHRRRLGERVREPQPHLEQRRRRRGVRNRGGRQPRRSG
jgi:hypothetical protein